MKIKQHHIEIVRSSVTGLSSLSLESCAAIVSVLERTYHVGVSTVNNLDDLKALANKKPDLVFLGMKFVPVDETQGSRDPNKIWVTDFLDDHDIAYTGSGQLAHELELNKPLAKQRVLDSGLMTAPFFVANATTQNDATIGFPLFVKPTDRGGGVGINTDSLVYTQAQLDSKVAAISRSLQSDSLVEQYLSGREFSVAILKDVLDEDYMVMPLELIAPADEKGTRLLSAEVKTSNAEQAIEIADEVTRNKVCELALNVFQALGARDYGRIDIRLNDSDVPYFLEANLIPSLIEGYGSFPKACVLNLDMDYETMILHIVRLGLSHAMDPYEAVLPDFLPATTEPV